MKNKKQKFINFLESIKTKENTSLVESVEKAFNIITESWEPFSEKVSNDAFKEEISNEMEEESPLLNDKIIKLGQYDVHILYYDNGNTEAWVKGLGTVATNLHWQKTSDEEFLSRIKAGIAKNSNTI